MLLCAVYKRGTDLIDPLYRGSKLVKPFSRLLLSGKYFTEEGADPRLFFIAGRLGILNVAAEAPAMHGLPIFKYISGTVA